MLRPLKDWFRRNGSLPAAGKRPARPPRRARLGLEALEGRLAPASMAHIGVLAPVHAAQAPAKTGGPIVAMDPGPGTAAPSVLTPSPDRTTSSRIVHIPLPRGPHFGTAVLLNDIQVTLNPVFLHDPNLAYYYVTNNSKQTVTLQLQVIKYVDGVLYGPSLLAKPIPLTLAPGQSANTGGGDWTTNGGTVYTSEIVLNGIGVQLEPVPGFLGEVAWHVTNYTPNHVSVATDATRPLQLPPYQSAQAGGDRPLNSGNVTAEISILSATYSY
jgi:hypothetical protein